MNTAFPRVVRYLISGTTAAAVDLVALYLLVDILDLWYLGAATIAFVLTLIVSFSMQKWWTFGGSSADPLSTQMAGYLALSIANVFVNAFLMYVAVSVLQVQYLVAQFFVIGVIAFYGFFAYRYWIFRDA